MALLIGYYDAKAEPGEAQARFTRLCSGRGTALSQLEDGPLRVAVFAQHAGERLSVPAASSAAAADPAVTFVTGAGGRGERAADTLAPPWWRLEYGSTTETLRVTPDRYGFALLYHRPLGTGHAFSTSALCLREPGASLGLEPAALAQMLAFDHLLGRQVLGAGVSLLPVGADLVISRAGLTTPQRFRYRELGPPMDDFARASAALLAGFRAAMRVVVPGTRDEPIVVPLSGGLDSRLLAAGLVELSWPTQTFTLSRAAVQGELPSDARIAEQVARVLGVPWQLITLAPDWLAQRAQRVIELTDGQCGIAHLVIANGDIADVRGRLVLDGIGGGIFAGRGIKRRVVSAGSTSERSEALWREKSRLDDPELAALLLPTARTELRELARRALVQSVQEAEDDVAGDPRWADVWTLHNRTRRFVNNGQLVTQGFAQPAFPFFAPAFFDRVFATHPALRIGAELQAAVYHAGFPTMAALPCQKSGKPIARPGLRGKLVHLLRHKDLTAGQAFFDHDAALRATPSLRAFVRDSLLDPRVGAAALGVFDVAQLERLLRASEQGSERGAARLALVAGLLLAARAWNAP